MSIDEIERAAKAAASRLSRSRRPTISVLKKTTRTLPKKWWQSEPQVERSEDRKEYPWWCVYLWPYEWRAYESRLDYPTVYETDLRMICIDETGQFGLSSNNWFDGWLGEGRGDLPSQPDGELGPNGKLGLSIGVATTGETISHVASAVASVNTRGAAEAPWGGKCYTYGGGTGVGPGLEERKIRESGEAERRLLEALGQLANMHK